MITISRINAHKLGGDNHAYFVDYKDTVEDNICTTILADEVVGGLR